MRPQSNHVLTTVFSYWFENWQVIVYYNWLGVYSPAQYLEVLWQYSASIAVILTSFEQILEKCVPLQV